MKHGKTGLVLGLLTAIYLAAGTAGAPSARAFACAHGKSTGRLAHTCHMYSDAQHFERLTAESTCETCGFVETRVVYNKRGVHRFACADAGHKPGAPEHLYVLRCVACGYALRGSAFVLPCNKPGCAETMGGVTTHNSCQNVHIIKNRPGKPGLPGFMPRYTGTAKRTTHVNATRKNAAFLGSTLHFGPMA